VQHIIVEQLSEAAKVLDAFIHNEEAIQKMEQASETMANAINNGGKIMTCGNGGSNCDAMHFAEELTGKFREPRRALPAIAISDAAHLTCVANDFGYDQVFSRYVEGLGKKGDVLLGLSTSGNSTNIINAVKSAKDLGMTTIVLTGKSGGELANISDIEIRVPHMGYSDRIQEIHIKIIHIIILLLEQKVVK